MNMNGNYYPAKPSTEDKRILLVEDDPNFGTVLKDYLVMSGFDVTLAKNGMEGFELFKKEIFDMCILDVMMPYKDGFTLAREIREKNEKIPIIFLTARTMREDVIKGYKSGGDDYLNKPFDSEILLMKIRSMLQRKNIETMVDNNKFEFEIGNFFLNTKLRILKYKDEEPMKLALSKIWKDDNYFTSRSMDVYIAKLRKLLKKDEKVEILNIHGEGFRLVANKDADGFI